MEEYPSNTRRLPPPPLTLRLEAIYHHLPLRLVLPEVPKNFFSYLLTKPDKPDNLSSIQHK
jgi:hypothetical protein